MKRTMGAIAAVTGIVPLLLSGGIQSKEPSRPVMFRANPQHTGVYETRGVHKVSELKWKFKTGKRVFPSPAITDGVIYFGSGDGNLYAVDIETGQEKWKFKTEGEAVAFSSPAVADGVAYFGSEDGNFYAVR